jgi:Ni2+-binding GTPase involved in maturation of urease and hydrogenase
MVGPPGAGKTMLARRHLTLEHLERDVLTTVLPDDDDTQEQHPWDVLAQLLHLQGVEATAEELRVLPYRVEFSERLRERLADDT